MSQVESNNKAAASVSYVNESGDCDRWMVTPSINVPSSAYSLQFRAFSAGTIGTEKLRIAVSTTTADKSAFTTTLRDIIFDGTDGATGGWNIIELPLSSYAGQDIRIAFVQHGNGQFVFVDDIKVSATTENYHMPLLESFTSQYCGNCPEGEEALEGAYAGLENRIAWVAHHAGYQDDAYTIQASKDLDVLYGTSTYAPAISIDRSMAYSSSNPGPVHQANSDVMMHQELSRASTYIDNIAMAITNINYTAGARTLELTVAGNFIESQEINNPRLTVYLVEDSLYAFQYGDDYMSSYLHDHVVRAALTDSWGDEGIVGSTTAGSTFSHTFNYTLPADYRPNHCFVVAFVSEYGSSATAERRVFQTTKSGYITADHGQPLGIEPTAIVRVKSYPNPATQTAYISAESAIHSFTVADLTGRIVRQERTSGANSIELDVSNMPAGIYIVSVVTDLDTATARLMVK